MGLGLPELTILLVFGIPLAAIIGCFMLGALKILKGDAGQRSRAQDAEETKMVQAIYHQLSQMEDRIEALEALLIDRIDRKRKEGGQ